MQTKQFLAKFSAILMIFFSKIFADSAVDTAPNSNKNNYEAVDIGTSTIRAKAEYEEYQSGSSVSKNLLDSAPSGNGDITSVLKMLPNVQFDTAQGRSTAQGEIDAADISISGGLFYQNIFLLDGFNMNNDINPAGGNTNGPDTLKSGHSQGLNIDSSLLDSIVVLDSNISASYGGFSGGVVEANVRNARMDGWHANISYQHTSNYLTSYHIDKSAESAFLASADENYQPKFHKHIIRANTEGYIIDDLGLVASFTTTQSFIPLQAYGALVRNSGTEIDSTRTQKRQSYNAYLKAHYNPIESLTIEANLAYAPQFNTYYHALAKNSYYTMRSGGIQTGLKALYHTSAGLWSNQLGYSRLENSRRSDSSYWMSWFASSDKNWAANSSNRVNEGGYGDMDQIQNTLNYKSDFMFESIALGAFKHDLRVGAEISYIALTKARLNDYIGFNNPIPFTSGACPSGTDNLGLYTCSNGKPFNKPNSPAQWKNDYDKAQGQYFNAISLFREAGRVAYDNVAYGFFAEDEITLDFRSTGSLKARVGFRVDGDNYMDKITIAPRFSLNYTTSVPHKWRTSFTFGANRYYGRNLFSYRFYDYNERNTKRLTRNSQSENWVESPRADSTSPYKFNRLNVPFSDELMGAITQNLSIFSATIKYIHRKGKDEIMQVKRNTLNAPPQSGYANNYTSWSNDGQSESHIVSLLIQNIAQIQTFGINHHYLFAFDYTQTKRSYNLYNADDSYYDNDDIMYNGAIIKYRDRPSENFALPYTLRLNTTHSIEWGRTRWMLNNLFRYRAGYERMVLLTKNSAGYDTNFSGSQYGKMRFKGAFNWDMRVGFEVDFYRGEQMRHTAYIIVDIVNVLNNQNMTTLSGVNGAISSGFVAASSAIPIYEVGRQFWLQVGYKF